MTKRWLKSYPEDIRENIETIKHSSLAELIETAMSKFPEQDAFTCMGTCLSFADLEEKSRQLGCYLLNQLNLDKGERVAVMMPNILQNPTSIYAVLRSGLTVVNINPLYTARELRQQLQDSGASTLIVLENFAHTAAEVVAETKVENVIVTSFGDMFPFPKAHLINFVLKYLKKMVPTYHLPKKISFKEALLASKDQDYKPHKIAQEDIAFLQYTGGTTGVSKGAVLTHKNMLANVEQAYEWIKKGLKEGAEVIITALPLYHIFSLTANCLTFTKLGGHNILIPNPRDITAFIKTLKQHKFTSITGVNTLFNALLNHPQINSVDFSHLKFSLGGGMAVQKVVAERWQKQTGVLLLEAYGLTETSPAVCINPLNLTKFKGSIGLPLSSTEVEIRDDNGQELPAKKSGELFVKGPQVMKEYWNKPEETKEVLDSSAWLRTGDIAYMDEEGYVFIVDRKKDMIIVSGFNVYPNEIEEILVTLEGIVEAAVIGIPDPKSGEAIKAFLVSNRDISKEEVIAHCRKSLTNYKVPKNIEFRKELPKTPVGKILRRALRDQVPQS